MIPRLRPSGWSFATRLLALALVPAFLMLVVVNVALYLVSLDEAQADIRERGRVVAAALSEGSRYGVISGNHGSIDRAIQGLMEVDRSLVAVEVLDVDRRPLVSRARDRAGNDAFAIEAPINAGALDVDLLDRRSQAQSLPGVAPGPQVAGYVRVTMSPTPLLEAKRHRLVQGSLLVLLACAVAAVVGLALARRLRRPLDVVMTALRRVRQGDFDVRIHQLAGGELGELQRAILDMAKGLGATHQQLEDEVARRTAELQEAMQAVQAADAERRRLIARGNELVEEERRRLSMEIHDELNAALVSVRLHASALSTKAATDDDDETQHAAERITVLIDDVYRRARAIVTQLRPEVIDTLGLAGAVEEVVRRFDELRSGCRFSFRLASTLPPIPDSVAIAAYRAVQEALSNVAKHARASRCNVVIASAGTADVARVGILVRDDGRGYDTMAPIRTGVGHIGMRERIAALDGSLSITSSPGAGTTVSIEIPLGGKPGLDSSASAPLNGRR